MKHCETCTCHIPKCGVEDCEEGAVYEGWARWHGPFGVRTGMIIKLMTCEEHKHVLIGFQKGEER